MTEMNQVYKCEICGNIVEVLHAGKGQLVCCGQPMKHMEARLTEGEGYEKHLPVIEVGDGVVKVKVGGVPHPMMEKHWIEWIALDTDKGVHRKFLKPGDEPEAVFRTGDKVLQAREYCNLHGHWATKA